MTEQKSSGRRDGAIGYGRPPASTRFRKGQSGNPKGRPPGRQSHDDPYGTVLDQMVTVNDGGVDHRMTVAQAFLLREVKHGLNGDASASRRSLAAIENARAKRGPDDTVFSIVRVMVRPGSVNSAMRRLRMAEKLDQYRPTARMAIEPWLVEAALARLGERKLTLSEQAEVYRATRTPHKVRWPAWWGSER